MTTKKDLSASILSDTLKNNILSNGNDDSPNKLDDKLNNSNTNIQTFLENFYKSSNELVNLMVKQESVSLDDDDDDENELGGTENRVKLSGNTIGIQSEKMDNE